MQFADYLQAARGYSRHTVKAYETDVLDLVNWLSKHEVTEISGLDIDQIRDWLYVGDHCSAIREVLASGRLGETYNIGGCNEKANIDVVKTICQILDELKPRADGKSYAQQITFVKDRPGHDRRYAIDASKIERELGWRPAETFDTGIRKTVQWYLHNPVWIEGVVSGSYRDWLQKQYN